MSITRGAAPLTELIASEQAVLRVPSRLEWIPPVVGYLRQQAERWGLCTDEALRRLGVVLEEALTNAIVHGNRQRIDRSVEVMVRYSGDRCIWTFTDQGEGFDHDRAQARQGSTGRGLLLMRAFADELRYEEGGRRILLTVCRRTAPTLPQPQTLPFLNPVEVFPVLPNRKIDYEHAFNGVCHELTPHGLRLLVRAPLTNTHVVIGINACSKVVFLPALIEGCEEVDHEIHSHACTFPTPFDPNGAAPKLDGLFRDSRQATEGAEKKLRDLSPQSQPGLERRQHPRVLFQEQMRLVRDRQDLVVFALNLSKGGIAFLVPEPVRVKDIYTLMMPQPSGTALPMPLRVIRCRLLHDRFHEAAGEFVLG